MDQHDLLTVNSKCIAIALDHLSADERDTILPYYRGLETYAAYRPKLALTADIIDLGEHLMTRRVQEAGRYQRTGCNARSASIGGRK